MKELIFASGNKGKVAEVSKIFNGSGYRVVSLYDLGDVPDIIEDGETFEDNARIKAQFIYDKYKLPVIADDSGLMVDQLNGDPGVYSARYAGENCTYEDNNRKLLQELSGLEEPHIAKFVCCAVYLDGENYECEFGEVPGKIINKIRGDKGFGYDPVFVPDGYDITLAEMDMELKNSISHRAKAFNKLKNKLIKDGLYET